MSHLADGVDSGVRKLTIESDEFGLGRKRYPDVRLREDRDNVAALQFNVLRSIVIENEFAKVKRDQSCLERIGIDSLMVSDSPRRCREREGEPGSVAQDEERERSFLLCSAQGRAGTALLRGQGLTLLRPRLLHSGLLCSGLLLIRICSDPRVGGRPLWFHSSILPA